MLGLPLCFRWGGGLVIGAINSYFLVSEATDIFITSVLRQQGLFLI